MMFASYQPARTVAVSTPQPQPPPPPAQARTPALQQEQEAQDLPVDYESESLGLTGLPESTLTTSSMHSRAACILTGLLSVAFITLVIPLAIFVIPYWTIFGAKTTTGTSTTDTTTSALHTTSTAQLPTYLPFTTSTQPSWSSSSWSSTRTTTTTLVPFQNLLHEYFPDPVGSLSPANVCFLEPRVTPPLAPRVAPAATFIRNESQLQHRKLFCFFDTQWRPSWDPTRS
ncbi:uncharacterized protein LOC144165037 isoform X2 [Haemaphysalis longicornis]